MRSFALTALLMLASASPSFGQNDQGKNVQTRLDCGPLTSSPNRNGPFTAPLTIAVLRGSLSAERPLISGDGKETFTGRIDPLGRIELIGKYEGRQSWIYRFRGQLNDQKPTVLKGGVEVTAGAAGARNCLITFIDKPADLMAAFSTDFCNMSAATIGGPRLANKGHVADYSAGFEP